MHSCTIIGGVSSGAKTYASSPAAAACGHGAAGVAGRRDSQFAQAQLFGFGDCQPGHALNVPVGL